MNLNRTVTIKINWVLDNLIPPVLRDNRYFMYPLIWLLFRGKTRVVMDFKSSAHDLDSRQIRDIYLETQSAHMQRETDLNQASIDLVLDYLQGQSVLDIACGSGHLCRLIAKKKPALKVVGADFIAPTSDELEYHNVNITATSFTDKQFDTVISAHTLEHIIDFEEALKELRRICRSRLIIVLPRQREYRFTYDLHVHFFPYNYSVLQKLKPVVPYELILCGGDWVYVETYDLEQ